MNKVKGLTFIETLFTISIIAILCMIIYPSGTYYIKHSKEIALKKNLYILRESIDKFYAVFSRYPNSLEELVEKKFLRDIPIDPITNSKTTWKIIPSQEELDDVFDVKSGATGYDLEGNLYENY